MQTKKESIAGKSPDLPVRAGHVLECRLRQGRSGVQFSTRRELSLPTTFDCLTQDRTARKAISCQSIPETSIVLVR